MENTDSPATTDAGAFPLLQRDQLHAAPEALLCGASLRLLAPLPRGLSFLSYCAISIVQKGSGRESCLLFIAA